MSRTGFMSCPASALLLGFLAGCATISGKLPAPTPPVATGEFRVGAAKVDITPMPGYPMGGYSVAGHISRGAWMRLQARAVCFEDAEGHGLAMVSADLWAIPGALGDRVAQLVAQKYGVPRLGREQILLAATHTHNGPGNFSSTFAYNALASPQSGFDRGLFDFLAHRIAAAIAEAWTNREPARLRYGETPVFGASRNRSIDAFRTNGSDALALIDQNRQFPLRTTSFRIGGEDAYRAVDPTLRVLRAERVGDPTRLVAAVAFFATHPTVMDITTEVYNSDIFGIATSQVERSLAATMPAGSKPVVALFNGPEGDVSANWRHRDRPDAIEVGTLLADGIRRVLESPGEEVMGTIAGRFGHSRLSDLATPMSGAPTLCGAEADWAFFRDAGFHEGMVQTNVNRQVEGQGIKRHLGEDDLRPKSVRDLVQFVMKHVLQPPGSVPIAVYRIGPLVIGTLPGEFTTILGRRIAAAIRDQSPGAQHVIMVGLANEYMSYFTTEEEYATQTYEASSMMYGPHAGTRIRDDLVALAKGVSGGEVRTKAQPYHYHAGPAAHFGVKEFDLLDHQDRLAVTHNALSGVLMDSEHTLPVPDQPRFIWIDKNPAWPADAAWRTTIAPSVAIEVKSGDAWGPLKIGGAPENDAGANIVTTIVGSFNGESRWITIWMLPVEVERDTTFRAAEFRFAVRSNGGSFHSPAFTLDSAHEAWGLTGIARKPENSGP